MQNEPEKTAGNYNELLDGRAPIPLPKGVIALQAGEQSRDDWEETIQATLSLVTAKVDEILGSSNKLKPTRLTFPKIQVVQTDPAHPRAAGYYRSDINEITVVSDKIPNEPISRAQVLIHELFHFLSHNGRHDSEHIHEDYPISKHNNIGFRRNFGLDIREGAEGNITTDYFLSFNEAVTEQLTLDILPYDVGVYSEYRGLLNQVIDDAVTRRLGANNESGTFVMWSRDQVKNYIYSCYFRGDLAGFTHLLQTTYAKYDLSEQQFGLMTNKDDLPSIVERKLIDGHPGGPPPAPSSVAALVQQRLNNKTPEDYVTDIIDPKPGDGGGHGASYDSFVQSAGIAPSSKEVLGGVEYDVDTTGLIIYRDIHASAILCSITEVLDELLVQFERGEIDATYINQQIDDLLFNTYRMSMLSEGFRDFYIYKHTKID